MPAKHQVKTVFETLKAHLRDRGLTYKQVAKKAHMSESNLKRIFASESCSFDRLVGICMAADTTIFDLALAAAKFKTPVFDLNQEVQDFFVENFDAFILFRRIAAAEDPNEYLDTVKLARGKLEIYLDKLVGLGLLSRKNGVIQVLAEGYLQIPDGSRLRSKIEEEWIPWFFSQLMNHRSHAQAHVQVASTALSEAHRQQLIQEMTDLLDKYRDIGFVDQKMGAGPAKPVGICVGIGPHRVGMF